MTPLQQARVDVAEIVGRMTTGDTAAIFALDERFHVAIGKVVRKHFGRLNYVPNRIEVDDMVHDFCLWLFDHASSWRPDGGALPWHWADQKIFQFCNEYIGTYCVSIETPWVLADGESVPLTDVIAERAHVEQPRQRDDDMVAVLEAVRKNAERVRTRLLADDPTLSTRIAVLRAA